MLLFWVYDIFVVVSIYSFKYFYESPLLYDVSGKYDPEIREKMGVPNSFDFTEWISSGDFNQSTITLGRLTFPSFSHVPFLPVLRTTPFWFVWFSGAVGGEKCRFRRRLFDGFPCTKFAANKNVRLVCLQNCIQTCQNIDPLKAENSAGPWIVPYCAINLEVRWYFD